MSRDISVFTEKAEPIPPEELLAALEARGIDVTWKADPILDLLGPANPLNLLDAGEFMPGGSSDEHDKINLTVKVIDANARESVLATYAGAVENESRDRLSAAKLHYQLSTFFSQRDVRDQISVELACLIAELGAGVVLDHQTNRLYAPADYIARSAGRTP